jgi:hypothetical protein
LAVTHPPVNGLRLSAPRIRLAKAPRRWPIYAVELREIGPHGVFRRRQGLAAGKPQDD